MAGFSRRLFGITVVVIAVLSTPLNALSRRRSELDTVYQPHSRRSYCVIAAGKCFSSGECCRGLVCAAIDDYFGQKPEVPGYCVKEKDLEECSTHADCAGVSGGRCVALGRTGERYCLPRSTDVVEQVPAVPGSTATGDLGSVCDSSADCRSSMQSSGEPLCCQDVRRGRQGVRRICDRVTPISTCIPPSGRK